MDCEICGAMTRAGTACKIPRWKCKFPTHILVREKCPHGCNWPATECPVHDVQVTRVRLRDQDAPKGQQALRQRNARGQRVRSSRSRYKPVASRQERISGVLFP